MESYEELIRRMAKYLAAMDGKDLSRLTDKEADQYLRRAERDERSSRKR
jgi:hypothetical protein